MKETAKNDMMLMAHSVKTGNNSNINLLKFNRSVERFSNVLKKLSGGTAEAGRVLRILREVPKAEKITDKALKDMITRLGGDAKLERIAEDMLSVTSPERYAKEALKSSTWDKLMEVRINGMLSGIPTLAINFIGNTTTTLMSQVEDLVATGISKIPRFGSGKLHVDDAVAGVTGLIDGMGIAAKKGFMTFLAETSPTIYGKIERAIKDNAPLEGIAKFVSELPQDAF
jgi:hypothetical protein